MQFSGPWQSLTLIFCQGPIDLHLTKTEVLITAGDEDAHVAPLEPLAIDGTDASWDVACDGPTPAKRMAGSDPTGNCSALKEKYIETI